MWEKNWGMRLWIGTSTFNIHKGSYVTWSSRMSHVLPHKVKMQYVHFRSHAEYFLLPWKFLKKLADNQCCSITKNSIYYVKHMYIQPFSMEVHWLDIWHYFNGSTVICLIFTHTAFLLCAAVLAVGRSKMSFLDIKLSKAEKHM